jgi:hypothetical protein
MAGSALLITSAVLGLFMAVGADRPVAAVATRVESPTTRGKALAIEAPAVSVTIEPVVSGMPLECDAPKVRPAGYVLPDEGTEDAGHAGS